MMTFAQVVKLSVSVTLNSPFQDQTHPDDRTSLSYNCSYVPQLCCSPFTAESVLNKQPYLHYICFKHNLKLKKTAKQAGYLSYLQSITH